MPLPSAPAGLAQRTLGKAIEVNVCRRRLPQMEGNCKEHHQTLEGMLNAEDALEIASMLSGGELSPGFEN